MVNVETFGGVARIILDAPQEKNKLSVRRLLDLRRCLGDLEKTDVEVVSLESGAPDIFAAGADIAELSLLDMESAMEFSRNGQALMNAFANFPAPVFCLVSGPCFGGALDLALACDYILASKDAKFCHPGVHLGIITGWGGTVRLIERVGVAVGRFLLLTGQTVDAEYGLQVGLVDGLFPTMKDVKRAFEQATTQLDLWPKKAR